MDITALITWIAAALGGATMLAIWLRRRSEAGSQSRIAPGLVLGHASLAAVGLALWIVYLFTAAEGLTWTAVVILVVVALLGFTMFARWLAGRREPGGLPDAPEQHFPVSVVIVHGLLGAATLVLVLLVAIGL